MDVDAIIRQYIVNSTQHRCLYHLTDGANLSSIKQHGLLSLH